MQPVGGRIGFRSPALRIQNGCSQLLLCCGLEGNAELGWGAWVQGREGGARAELGLEWKGCTSKLTQAEVEVWGGVEMGVSSLFFAR